MLSDNRWKKLRHDKNLHERIYRNEHKKKIDGNADDNANDNDNDGRGNC